jgi:hypothetical protein
MRKNIIIKVYDNEGNFKEAWKDARFVGFSKEVNGGMGECVIDLARKFDDYGEYSDVSLNNEVRIMITDKDTEGTDDKYKLIYSGFISEYQPWVNGKEEGVKIQLLGYYTKLANDIYKNGTTTTITETAEDIGVMFRNLMDRYIAETSDSKLHYSKETIRETGTDGTYSFEMMTYREAIDVIKSMAPTNWWWYVNQYNEVLFKSKPTTATHTFIFGKHFSKVDVKKSLTKIKNAVLFWNTRTDADEIYKLYSDTYSIGKYGRRVKKIIDQDRVGAEADADLIGDAFVAENKEPHIEVSVEIIDNNGDDNLGYDIESIEPGDTCNFQGFNESLNETFKENMLITRVDYQLDKVIITIEPLRAGVINRQEEINKKVDELSSAGVPSDYTT